MQFGWGRIPRPIDLYLVALYIMDIGKCVGNKAHFKCPMNHTFSIRVAIAAGGVAVLLPFTLLAAGQPNFAHNGLGQRVADPTRFGISVCNMGDTAPTRDVSISVQSNGQTASWMRSKADFAPGTCEYEYLSYNRFGMQPGNSYTVTVRADPENGVAESSESDNVAIYTGIVPRGAVTAAAPGVTPPVSAIAPRIAALPRPSGTPRISMSSPEMRRTLAALLAVLGELQQKLNAL